MIDIASIHDAIEQAGLSVLSVRNTDDTQAGIVVFLSGPTPEAEAQAAAIVASFFTPE